MTMACSPRRGWGVGVQLAAMVSSVTTSGAARDSGAWPGCVQAGWHDFRGSVCHRPGDQPSWGVVGRRSEVVMDREAVSALVLESKRARGLTFGELAEHVGADPVWLTAALLGQHPLTAEQAALVIELLGLP